MIYARRAENEVCAKCKYWFISILWFYPAKNMELDDFS
ncbi:hypothetical protein BRCON_2463 [Candidatus Sumerlaea chitinivorans]|uniref:Uncharacterized protein n=1 Tax=Sumerlaea chitinivorans TaxID=2250252 RepID=A0A2Z4Y9X1_SUMC1|nr:hypothetical protein BRCON_2463 [Candidatus Sumerlaea chitinivorans]